jgi:hypothetical protein
MADFQFVVNDVAPASTAEKIIACITAGSSTKCLPRRVTITTRAGQTAACVATLYRCSSVSGGTSVTANNLDTRDTTTQQFTVVKNPTSATLGAVIGQQVLPTNFGTAVLSVDAGLEHPGAKLHAGSPGESLAIVFQQLAALSESPNYVTPVVEVAVSQQ